VIPHTGDSSHLAGVRAHQEPFGTPDPLLLKQLTKLWDKIGESLNTFILDSFLLCKHHLRQFIQDGLLIDEEFSKWPTSQPEEWRPKIICLIENRQTKSGPSFWPGNVDTYFDRKEYPRTAPIFIFIKDLQFILPPSGTLIANLV